MPWPEVLYLIPVMIAATITASLTLYVWRHRDTSAATSVAALMLVVTIWLLVSGLTVISDTPEGMRFWDNVRFACVASVPVVFLIFVLQYTGRDRRLTRGRLAMLLVIPLTTQIIVWTNETHGLFFQSGSFSGKDPGLVLTAVTFGPWFWVHTAYSYSLILLGIVLLVFAIVRSFDLYRQQAVVLLVGIFVPLGLNVLTTFRLVSPRFYFMPLGFAFMGLMFAWAIFRHRFLDLVPIARDKLVDTMGDALIVLDDQNRIVDLNPAAQNIIGIPTRQIVGQPATQILSPWQDLIDRFGNVSETRAEISQEQDGTKQYYDLRISPLMNQRDRLTGRLIVLRDITERKQAEKTLQALNHRMQDELALAHGIQQSLLPPPQPDWPCLDVICYNAPARELGGDFYRYYAFPANGKNRWESRYAFAVGDVSGKGVSAALLMAASLSQFDAALPQSFNPHERLAYLDTAITPYTKPRGQNCALCYIELELSRQDPEKLLGLVNVVNAGCIPPYIRRRDGKVEWPEVGGFALGQGLGAETGYEQVTLNLSSGDLVILVSDGVIEATNVNGEMYGFERLVRTIATGPLADAKSMLNHLQSEMLAFVGEAEQRDDITLVVVQVE